MNQTKTTLATLMLVALALAPVGTSDVDAPLAATTAPTAGVLEQELLTALGWEGSLGIDGSVLDAAAAHGLDEVGSPSQAVASARGSLDRLQAAQGISGVFAAAAHATGASVSPQAPAAGDLAAAIAELYVRSGAHATAEDLLELRLATSSLDAGVASGLAQVVAAMNDALQARATGDVPAMLQGSADVLAAIEEAAPLMQASSSSTCDKVFEDPLFFIIVAGPCDDTHDVDRYLSIDQGGNDTYTNNAGGADVTNPFAYVNPAHDIGSMGTMPGALLNSLLSLNTTEIDSLVADLSAVQDPNYVYDRYSDDYYGRLAQVREDNAPIVSFPAILGQAVADCLATCGVDPNFDPVEFHDHGAIGVAVDLGGNDVYDTDKEAAQGGARNAIGILADLGAGTDSYSAPNLAQGASERGVGILVDDGGDDTYNAGRDAQGGFDSGYLLDLGGNDGYNGGAGTQGGRRIPFGAAIAPAILYDASGDDTYWADGYAQGAGNILIDGSGTDSYTAVGPSPADTFAGVGQGVGFLNAHGLLLDGAGDDAYSITGEGGQGYGLDGYGSGSLIDLAGDDTYWASEAGQGVCSVDIPFGALLYDGGGDDSYTAGTFGQGASRAPCSAYLVDRAGNDAYTGARNSQGATELDAFESTLGFTGVGILADGGGDDTYTSGDWSQGASEGSGLGLLLDADGVDTYTAGANSQGAGGQGMGVLLDGLQDAVRSDSDLLVTTDEVTLDVSAVVPGDESGGDSYTAGDYSQGSSGPDGWVGILVDNDDESGNGGGPHVNTYTAGLYSQGSAVAAGVGAFVDREGRDVYTVSDETLSRGYGGAGYLTASVALFLDAANKHDEYSGFMPPTAGNDRIERKGSGFEIDTEGLPTAAMLGNIPQDLLDLLALLTTLQPGPGEGCAAHAAAYFCDDVEGATQFTATAGVNEWRIVDQGSEPQAPGQPNAYSGTKYWYVGAPGYPGVAYLGNDDGSVVATRTTLVSNAFAIPATAVAPTLSFRLAGQVENDPAGTTYDRLIVSASDGVTNQTLVLLDGVQGYDSDRSYAMDAFIGSSSVQVTFTFFSDLNVEEGPGFNLDDVVVE